MTGFLLSQLLALAVGCCLTKLIWRDCHWASLLGYGYFIGQLCAAFCLLLWDSINLKLQFTGPAFILAALASWLALILYRQRISPSQESGIPLSHWQYRLRQSPLETVGIAALIVFALFRLGLMLEDSIYRPIYAWDALMNFAPKAKVWFEQAALERFVYQQDWLQCPVPETCYTLFNEQAVGYPPLIPLILLWAGLGVGEWADNLVKLPWIFAFAALILALYGQLRQVGYQRLPALLLAYLLLSIPYLNVHAVLGGYAELWVASSLAMAIFSWLRWRESPQLHHVLVTLIMLLISIFAKRSAIVWVGVLMLAIFADAIGARKFLALAFVASVVALGAIAAGIDIELPWIGTFELSSQRIHIGKLIDQPWIFTNVSAPVVNSLFLSSNWNIFWYLALAAIAGTLLSRAKDAKGIGPWVFLLGSMLAFGIIFFTIQRYSREAMNLTTLNRAIVQLVPAYFVIFCWWLRDVMKNISLPVSRKQREYLKPWH